MKLYRVKWPNGSVELVYAEDLHELFLLLDEEGDPYSAEVEEVKPISGLELAVVSGDTKVLKQMKVVRKISPRDWDRVWNKTYGRLRVVN